MIQTIQFASDAPALTQLLAVSLRLMTLMRQHSCLCLYLPKHVHLQLNQADFGQVLYDLLSSEYSDLEDRLVIQVHPKSYFLILTQPSGVLHEIT